MCGIEIDTTCGMDRISCGSIRCGSVYSPSNNTSLKLLICIDYNYEKNNLIFANEDGDILKYSPKNVKEVKKRIGYKVIGVKVKKDNEICLIPDDTKDFYKKHENIEKPKHFKKHFKHMKELKKFYNENQSYDMSNDYERE